MQRKVYGKVVLSFYLYLVLITKSNKNIINSDGEDPRKNPLIHRLERMGHEFVTSNSIGMLTFYGSLTN